MSSRCGALLSCLRMRWKVSLWIVASSCYCDVKSCQHLNAAGVRVFFLIHSSECKINWLVNGFSRTDNSTLCFWFKCSTKSGIHLSFFFAYCCFGVWAQRLNNNSPLDTNSTPSSNNYCIKCVDNPHDFSTKDRTQLIFSMHGAHCHWELAASACTMPCLLAISTAPVRLLCT